MEVRLCYVAVVFYLLTLVHGSSFSCSFTLAQMEHNASYLAAVDAFWLVHSSVNFCHLDSLIQAAFIEYCLFTIPNINNQYVLIKTKGHIWLPQSYRDAKYWPCVSWEERAAFRDILQNLKFPAFCCHAWLQHNILMIKK